MQQHYRKTYYPTGLISLLLLPVFCILYLKSIDAFTHYGSIDIHIWNGKEAGATKGITKFLHSKKYNTVYLTGNTTSDTRKLNQAESRVREIITTKDSITGIRFHFGTKSEYWTYIRVLEILGKEKALLYVPYKNDIWLTNPKPRKKESNLTPIPSIHCGYTPNYIHNEEFITTDKITAIVQKYYLSILSYVLMLFFTIRKIYKLNNP